MANHRIVIYPDLPRMATIHAKLNNHPCSQPAHLVWPPLASPLRISGLQPHWLAFNSSKHYTFPDLRVLPLFPLCTILSSLCPPTFSYLTLTYPSVSPQIITCSETSLLHFQTRVTYPLLSSPIYISSIAIITNVASHIFTHLMINIYQPY